MITFKQFIAESSEILTGVQAKTKIGNMRWNTITKGKWYKDYMQSAQTIGAQVGFRVREDGMFTKVDVAHGPIGDSKLRRYLMYTFSGNKLINIALFQNTDDKKFSGGALDGQIHWKHIKSLHEE